MWWTGRIPGLSDDEDRRFVEDEKKLEQFGPELITEILELLGDNGPPPIPVISFERIPGEQNGLVKPREIHIRNPIDGRPTPYRGPGKTPYYRISNTDASIIKQTLEYNGFRELTTNSIGLGLSPHDWVVQWSGPNYRDYVYQNLHEYQYVNHFSGSTELTRKDRVWCHFQAMQRLFGKLQFDFLPETFVMPDQLEAFIQVYERTDYLWIVKPHASSRGRGIFILQELSEIPLDCVTVISRYVDNPYLIQGLKFDLRLYVLVTGFDPLRIYLFKEGLTRFASSVFSTTEEDLGNVYKHLTNYSINKYASNFVENEDASQDNVGHKWSLSALNKHLACCNVDIKLTWSRIIDVVIKTILTVERPVVHKMKNTVSWRSNCFELYGFDLLLDENLKPHLLEVNLSPSMQADTPLDYKIKSSLVQETFNLLGPKLADQKQLGETRWKSRAKQLKRQGQRMPYGQPLAATNQMQFGGGGQTLQLKPTVLNTPAARAREAERQQKFHNLQKKNLPLASLGEKPLRLLLECVQEFTMANDFIRIFPTQASVKRYGHMIGIGSTAKSMSASQLLCLALFNEPRLVRAKDGRSQRKQRNRSQPSSPVKQLGLSSTTTVSAGGGAGGAGPPSLSASTNNGAGSAGAAQDDFDASQEQIDVTGGGSASGQDEGGMSSSGEQQPHQNLNGPSSSSSSSGLLPHLSSASSRKEQQEVAGPSAASGGGAGSSSSAAASSSSTRNKLLPTGNSSASSSSSKALSNGDQYGAANVDAEGFGGSSSSSSLAGNSDSMYNPSSPTSQKKSSRRNNRVESPDPRIMLNSASASTTSTRPKSGSKKSKRTSSNPKRRNSRNYSLRMGGNYDDHEGGEDCDYESAPAAARNYETDSTRMPVSEATTEADQKYLNSHNSYWSSSVVSTEGSKRGLDALEKRIKGLNQQSGGGDLTQQFLLNQFNAQVENVVAASNSSPSGRRGRSPPKQSYGQGGGKKMELLSADPSVQHYHMGQGAAATSPPPMPLPTHGSPMNRLRTLQASGASWQSYYRNYGGTAGQQADSQGGEDEDGSPGKFNVPTHQFNTYNNSTNTKLTTAASYPAAGTTSSTFQPGGGPGASLNRTRSTGGHHAKSQQLLATGSEDGAGPIMMAEDEITRLMHQVQQRDSASSAVPASNLAKKAYPTNKFLKESDLKASELIGPPVDVTWSPGAGNRSRAMSMPRPRSGKTSEVKKSAIYMGLDIEL